MESQGYQVMENIVYQDNKRTNILDKKVNWLSSKCTKSINISLFFVTDHIINKELNVEWFPINNMIGDFMNKTTQEILFNNFRNLIMGVIPVKNDIQENETKKNSQ